MTQIQQTRLDYLKALQNLNLNETSDLEQS